MKKKILVYLLIIQMLIIGVPFVIAGTWYKGDLHVHTGYSSMIGYDNNPDADEDDCWRETFNYEGQTIEEIRNELHQAQYDAGGIWISITDHSYCLDSTEWSDIVSDCGLYTTTYEGNEFLFCSNSLYISRTSFGKKSSLQRLETGILY